MSGTGLKEGGNRLPKVDQQREDRNRERAKRGKSDWNGQTLNELIEGEMSE